MCQSIPSHETLITKTQAVVKSCQTMTQKCAGHNRRAGGGGGGGGGGREDDDYDADAADDDDDDVDFSARSDVYMPLHTKRFVCE